MKKSASEVERLINETRAELFFLRGEKQTAVEAHAAHIEELEKKLFDSRRTFAKFRRKNSVRLHSYSAAIQEVRSGEKLPRNIISFEGQLWQSLHQMNIQDNQLKIMKKATGDILADYHMSHDEVLRGKQFGEHVLMKAIVEFDDEKKEEEERLRKKTSEQEEDIQQMRRELHEKCPPQLFLPSLQKSSGEVESVEVPRRKASFFKVAQRLTSVLKRAGNVQSPEDDGQQYIPNASPSCIRKINIHDVHRLKPSAVSKKGNSSVFLPEMPPLKHMMSHATVA
eukprot:CAMPEP_0119012864 /NCGR_PEP_ID=MMETSP1176-20130426/7667_1 /TAXON_ID=265551 /ORGANISM="Synedropsis recta cf, Strain CCMP1620" /LENGTH=281 /DNA_ID=CAMNT_0006965899 /DNA_START=129 /DNA_END=974 /DNA_ORIENTATION=+